MSGETSKYIGELGEDLASKFLDLLGWTLCGSWNSDFSCENGNHKTASEKAQKKSHGIDGVYSYQDPYSGVLEVVLIESKAISWKVSGSTGDYLSSGGISTGLTNFAETLAQKVDCAQRSSEFKKNFGLGSRAFRVSALLIYYVREGFELAKWKESLGKVTFSDEQNNDRPIFILSNDQLTFITSIIKDVKNRSSKNHDEQSRIFYPEFERKNCRNPWGTVLTLDQLYSSFLMIRRFETGVHHHDIYYRGSYEHEALKRFYVALSRFGVFSHSNLSLIPSSKTDVLKDRHAIDSLVGKNQVVIADKEVSMSLRDLDEIQISFKHGNVNG